MCCSGSCRDGHQTSSQTAHWMRSERNPPTLYTKAVGFTGSTRLANCRQAPEAGAGSREGRVRSHDFPQSNQRDLPRPVLLAKINLFSPPPNQRHNSPVSSLNEGRIAIVTDVGMGCGGRGSARCADTVAGRAMARERSAARQTNDAEAYGEVVWSWRPVAGVKLRRGQTPIRGDGGKKARSPGRSRDKP